MSRHEGVSCDSCSKGNFRGRRYKCLICYDYDLCSTCYEAGARTARHSADHAMQCIITRADIELYYGGETGAVDQPQSYTCPFCGKPGFIESTLHDHVTSEHPDTTVEVVCPICAGLLGGDPNHVTDDFSSHLSVDHRAQRVFEDPTGMRHGRRISHTSRGGGGRTRRSNMAFHTVGGGSSSGGVGSLGGGHGGVSNSTSNTLMGLGGPSSRDPMDPITELLSQLSSVRGRSSAAASVSSQLHQLEMQLQSTRQQLERLPRRQADPAAAAIGSGRATAGSQIPQVITQQQQQQPSLLDYAGALTSSQAGVGSAKTQDSNFLLSKLSDPEPSEEERQRREVERADRSVFVQELLLSTLSENLRIDDDLTDIVQLLEAPLTSDPPGENTAHTAVPHSESEPPGKGGGGSKAAAVVSDAIPNRHNAASNTVPSPGMGQGGVGNITNCNSGDNSEQEEGRSESRDSESEPSAEATEYEQDVAQVAAQSGGGVAAMNMPPSAQGFTTSQPLAARNSHQAIRNKRKGLESGAGSESERVQDVKH